MRTVAWVSNSGRLNGAELHALDVAAEKIGTTADALVAVMQFESGLNPAARTPRAAPLASSSFYTRRLRRSGRLRTRLRR